MLQLLYWNLEIYKDENVNLDKIYLSSKYRNPLILDLLISNSSTLYILNNINYKTTLYLNNHIDHNFYKTIYINNIMIIYNFYTIKDININSITNYNKGICLDFNIHKKYRLLITDISKFNDFDKYLYMKNLLTHYLQKNKITLLLGTFVNNNNIIIDYIKHKGLKNSVYNNYTLYYSKYKDDKVERILESVDNIWYKNIVNIKTHIVYPDDNNLLGFPDKYFPSSHMILICNFYHR